MNGIDTDGLGGSTEICTDGIRIEQDLHGWDRDLKEFLMAFVVEISIVHAGCKATCDWGTPPICIVCIMKVYPMDSCLKKLAEPYKFIKVLGHVFMVLLESVESAEEMLQIN